MICLNGGWFSQSSVRRCPEVRTPWVDTNVESKVQTRSGRFNICDLRRLTTCRISGDIVIRAVGKRCAARI